MRGMYVLLTLLGALVSMAAMADERGVTEDDFRRSLNLGSGVRMEYRDLECRPIGFDRFAADMRQPGVGSQVERAADGAAVTMTVHRRGTPSCPSPYPPITEMPPFDLRDLDGRRVTSAGLRGKPTLVNFYFARCVPCILEVEPLNRFAASRPDMNFLAVTFDEPDEARDFIRRFGFRWRVVPDARDFIDRMRVKNYPLLALFDAEGRLLGTKRGGARDELEAAAVFPQVKRWVEGLQRTTTVTTGGR
jgi:cytochrome oxidase Cu insertion factor (SCO1/SenC/PrrC family)